MHVDVHLTRVHVHKKRHLRIVAAGQAAFVGLAHGGQQALVRHRTVVDKEQGRQAVHADAVALPLKGAQGLHDQAGPEQGQAVAQGLAGQKAQSLALAGMQAEAHFRPGQGQTRQPVLGAFEFRGRGL